MNRIRLLSAFLAFSLLLGGLLSAADPAGGKTWVIVNSADYKDVIGGAVFAAQNNYSYAFALTPAHAEYLVNFIKSSASPVLYYESAQPVSSSMGGELAALHKDNFALVHNDSLHLLFANMARSDFSVLVGAQDGAEAVSIAPYAVLMNGGLYFADPSDRNVQFSILSTSRRAVLDAPALLASLQSSGRKVLVYGSIANDISPDALAGADAIRTGSRYGDNLQAIQRYYLQSQPDQMMFVSGRTFEASMVRMPVALSGPTEVNPDLVAWLRASAVRRAIVIQGDADIKNAMDSLRLETGLPVFGALAQGYSGNAEVQPLAVMKIPGPELLISLGGVSYDAGARTFQVDLENKGASSGFVQVAMVLPDGRSSSSSVLPIPPGQTRQFSVGLDASSYVTDGRIREVIAQISAGSQPAMTESVYLLNVSGVQVLPGLSPSSRPASGAGRGAEPPLLMSSSPNPDTFSYVSWAAVLIIALVAVFALSILSKPARPAASGQDHLALPSVRYVSAKKSSAVRAKKAKGRRK
ncbi:MAG: hypothetical protein V1728_04870 [Candidatus Micrarchaeota archaeon]